MWALALIVIYCTLIVMASLAGGWLPAYIRLTHTRMQVMLSLVSGLMLGVALFHLLPHAAAELPSMQTTCGGVMVGLLGMFFLIRIFHFHHHPAPAGGHSHHGHADHHNCLHDHGEHAHAAHSHAPQPLVQLGKEQPPPKPAVSEGRVTWMGLFVGLAVHTLLDGAALAASVAGEARSHAEYAALGLGTFLAIALHKPLDAMSIASVMQATGWSRRAAALANAGFAAMCPLGAGLFWLSLAQLNAPSVWLGLVLAFSAGVFLCISLGDLLPELQFHSHDRVKLSAALLLGIAIAWGIEHLPVHAHPHPADPAAAASK